MARIEITHEEIMEALISAHPAGPEKAKTVQELAMEFSISPERVRKALKRLQSGGVLGVHNVHRTALDGTRRLVPAYTYSRNGKK